MASKKNKAVPGFEPGSLDSKSSVLTTTLYGQCNVCEHAGTRTRNPQFRRLIRYPLRHAPCFFFLVFGWRTTEEMAI